MSAHPSDRLLPYQRGELAAAERAAVEAHLAECAECRAALADFAAIAARLERAPEPAPPIHWGAFRAELRESLARRSAPERRGRRWSLGGLPAALAAGLAVVVLYLAIPGGNGRAPVGDQAAAGERRCSRAASTSSRSSTSSSASTCSRTSTSSTGSTGSSRAES